MLSNVSKNTLVKQKNFFMYIATIGSCDSAVLLNVSFLEMISTFPAVVVL